MNMRISLQPQIINNQQIKRTGISSNPFIKSDCSYDIVSFGNIKHVDNFFNLPKKEIFARVEKILKNKEGCLGSGCEASVYSIPDTKYCVKVYNACAALNDLSSKTTDINKNILPKDKVNHVVAKIGDNLSIMERIEGTPVYDWKLSDEENKYIIESIIKFPVVSFHKLFKQIANAHNEGMSVDAHYSNLIVNLDNKSFSLIDLCDNSSGLVDPEPMFSIFKCLLSSSIEEDNQILEIANKVLKTGLYDLKLGGKPSFKIKEYDFQNLLDYIKFISSSPYFNLRSYHIDFDSLKNDFNELLVLKESEMQGANCKDLLNSLISRLEKSIDENFPIQDKF